MWRSCQDKPIESRPDERGRQGSEAAQLKRVVMMAESKGVQEQIEESAEELHARALELQQKLAISEQAVDDKNKELQAIREALESAKSKAAADVELVQEEEKQKRIELEHDFRETIKSWE